MQNLPSSAFVCWRCVTRRSARTVPSFGRLSDSSLGARGLVVARGLATVQNSEIATANANLLVSVCKSEETREPGERLLESLRQWELENPSPGALTIKSAAAAPSVSHCRNSALQSSDEDIIRQNMEMDFQDTPRSMFDSGDMLDLRADSVGLGPGDLLEIKSDRWSIQILAVCLGNFHGLDHFYTDNGNFFMCQGIRTNFVVKKFAKPEELKPIINALPEDACTPELLATALELKEGPSRELGSALIKKMQNFHLLARLKHQTHVARLSDPLKYLDRITGSKETLMSLSELADALIQNTSKADLQHTPEALYAVHTALTRDWLSFRAIGLTNHQQSYLFEVAAARDVELVAKVETMVRDLYDEISVKKKMMEPRSLWKYPLGRFILKARDAIKESRKRRAWTPYGLLAPSAAPAAPAAPRSLNWEPVHHQLFRFMHIWSAEGRLSRGSRLHWIGSAILRLLDQYGESEFLSPAVGWTFLQEVGWVKPWDIRSRYSLRLPGVEATRSGGIDVPTTRQQKGPLLGPDKHAGNRRTFDLSTVFCIDSPLAADIDDGMSIEPTERSDEFWVHVHVADPASRLAPDSVLAERASLLPRNLFLAGHYERMLNEGEIRDTFSLGPGKPCLTFSARVNKKGDILESNIAPGTLGDVVYMAPDDIDELLGLREELPSDLTPPFAVGSPPRAAEEPPNRPMTDPASLSAEKKSQLLTLAQLMLALHAKRAAEGAIPYHFPQTKVEVSLDSTVVQESTDGFVACWGDPYIRVSYEASEGCRVVSNAMVLAGEVAAQWCRARRLPIPYLVQPKAAQNKKTLDEFTRDVFYPQLEARQRPTDSEYRQLVVLMGGADMSTVGGMNYAMGVGLYARATSPLRRFTDLLLHWQVTAALVEEQRTGRSLQLSRQVPDVERLWQPFSHDALEKHEFPRLRVRDNNFKILEKRDGLTEWMLQALIRAWKLGDEPTEGGPLPAKFRFRVGEAARHLQFLTGELDWFDLRAVLLPEDLVPSGMLLADVKAGDEFEVELRDVNVYWKKVYVKALRLISRSS